LRRPRPSGPSFRQGPGAAIFFTDAGHQEKTLVKRIIVLVGLVVAGAALVRAEVISGKVAETMDSAGYTYARVTHGGSSTWVAAPVMPLKVGDDVSFQSGTVMNDFESPTLHKKFDSIVFSPGPVAAGAGGSSHGGGKTHAGSKGAKKDASAKADKASGADAYTVAEVYAKRAELAGKAVSVRGKVVKVNEAMDLIWVHLQDGSGDAKGGDFDLLATTTQEAKVGETLTAHGVVAKDKDFTMGYKYAVMLEKATLSR
jgi:hypothetical protein